MSILVETRQAMLDPLATIIQSIVQLLPGLVAGIVILLFGYLVAQIVAYIVQKVVVRAQLDKWLVDKTGLKSLLGRFDLGALVHVLAKWYTFLLFWPAAADVISLDGLSNLLRVLAMWVPNLIVAVILGLLGYVAAEYASAQILATRIKGAHAIADSAWAVVLVFTAIMALQQVSVSVSLAESTFLLLVGGIVFAVALALGLGFGLALKDEATNQLKRLKKML